MWSINWEKLSEIVFDALLTGTISALVVYIAFRLGQRQADKNWKREIERRDKERKEVTSEELTKRRIEILLELLDFRGKCEYKVSMDYYKNSNVLFDGNEKHRMLISILKAQTLFQSEEDNDIQAALNELDELTSWSITTPDTENDAQRRTTYVKNIFDPFAKKLHELEKMLL